MRDNKPIKVLFVQPWGKGAMMHYTHCQAEALAELGLEVEVLTSEHCDVKDLPKKYHIHEYAVMWDQEEAPLKSLPQKILRRLARLPIYMKFWNHAYKVALESRPDVIHFHDIVFEIDYFFIRRMAKTGAVLGDTVHNVLPFAGSTVKGAGTILRDAGWIVAARKRIYSLFDFILFHTPGMKRNFNEVFSLEGPELKVVPHGDYMIYRETSLTREEARRKLNLPVDGPLLLCFGAIRKYKGVDAAIKILAELVMVAPGARLLVAGAVGSDVNMDDYDRLAAELGVKESLTIIPEYISNDQVMEIYRAADIALLPYQMVYHSGPLLLAWKNGTPVAASNVGGLREMVDDGKNGLLFPVDDIGAAAAACHKIITEPELAASMAACGAEVEKQRRSWSESAEKTYNIYTKLIERRNGGR